MPKLEVLVGLPGSGKSTRLKFVDDPEFGGDAFVYSTDAYIEARAKDQDKTYDDMFDSCIGDATKHMNDVLAIAISAGIDVWWDQTNMSSKKRKAIISKFPKTYRKECWCIRPPVTDEEWADLEIRLLFREGKTIPQYVIKSMSDSYIEPELDEGFDVITIVDLYDNVIKLKGE